ncbi:MAG: BrnT family toxin [Bryobacterales bacterium]|nr:BrnT family toxin [Bryobacterales bacterium]
MLRAATTPSTFSRCRNRSLEFAVRGLRFAVLRAFARVRQPLCLYVLSCTYTAQLIFDDPNCVTFIERTKDGEPRWHAIGFAEGLILLVAIHTIAMWGRTN